MPLAERTIRDPYGVEIGDVGLEMQTQSVIGERFRRCLELAKTQPWDEAMNGVKTQEPERGQTDQDMSSGMYGIWLICNSFCCEDDEDPESDAAEPAAEAVHAFECVVGFAAELWVCEDNYASEEKEENIGQNEDWDVSKLAILEAHREEDGKADEP
jgi:hypothetical protein